MTLSSLSPTQRAAPQEDFDTNKVRTIIADYLGIDVRRVSWKLRTTMPIRLKSSAISSTTSKVEKPGQYFAGRLDVVWSQLGASLQTSPSCRSISGK